MDEYDATQRALALYVNRASDLAESVKKDIQKRGYISEKTVLALNAFITAANNIADLSDALEDLISDLN